jgi:hypothetical protein
VHPAYRVQGADAVVKGLPKGVFCWEWNEGKWGKVPQLKALVEWNTRQPLGIRLPKQRPFTRAGDRLGATFRLQLAEQVAHMLLDGRQGNHQAICDLPVGCASRKQV